MSLNVTFLEFVRPVSGRAGPPFFGLGNHLAHVLSRKARILSACW